MNWFLRLFKKKEKEVPPCLHDWVVIDVDDSVWISKLYGEITGVYDARTKYARYGHPERKVCLICGAWVDDIAGIKVFHLKKKERLERAKEIFENRRVNRYA